MHQRKFIFLEAIDDYSVNNKHLKGHAQFSEMKNKVMIKLFVEGLAKEEYGVDLLLEESTCTNIGNFHCKNNNEKTFYVNDNLKEIIAILIYPLSDEKKIMLVGYLRDKDKVNIKEIGYSRVSELQQKKSSQVKAEGSKEEKELLSDEKELLTSNRESISDEKEVLTNNKESISDEKELLTNNKELISDKKEEYNANESKRFSEENLTSKNDYNSEQSKVQSNKSKEVNQDNVTEDINYEELQANKDNHMEIESNKEVNKKGAIYNNQIFYLWENLDKLDNALNPANPFMQPVPKHKWWQIREYDTDIQYYCILYNGYMMPMIYPFMNYKNISMIDKEWVFGVVTEDYGEKEVLKYFVYGIPGKFYMQEQPFKGSTGYLYWQSSDVVSEDPMGYWLLYVDVHTGKIVIPRRPVKPPLNKNIMHNNM